MLTAKLRHKGRIVLRCRQCAGPPPDMATCMLLQVEYEKQVAQLADLITVINTDLTKNERKKLITLCTIDVHARDVVARLIEERVESGSAFQWQSQLRYYQHEKTKECQVRKLVLRCHLLIESQSFHVWNNALHTCILICRLTFRSQTILEASISFSELCIA